MPLHGDDFNDDLMRGARAEDYTGGSGAPDNDAASTPALMAENSAAALIAATAALTNPPELATLSSLLGRLALAGLDPLPERQILARIKTATGISMSILDKQLAELRRRVNATGDPMHGSSSRHGLAGCARTFPALPNATRPMSSSP